MTSIAAIALINRHDGIALTLGAAREHVDRATAALHTLPANAYRDALSELADFVVERGS